MPHYMEVATAQTATLERERAVARSRGQLFAASIALVKSLGGGWQGLEPVGSLRSQAGVDGGPPSWVSHAGTHS